MKYLDNYCWLLKEKLLKTGFVNEDDISGFKMKKMEKNLYVEMSGETLKQYKNGDGNELSDGKMNMIRSSSAMIYNLLGNGNVTISGNDKKIPSGTFNKEFEKKLPTLKRSPKKANLDAWLSNSNSEIFIESKCLEWIENGHEKELREAYTNRERYYDSSIADTFIKLGLQIPQTQYDSCQMFKHTLAIYNYLKKEQPEKEKICLLNIIYEPSIHELPKEIQQNFQNQLELEHKEFRDFYNLMLPIINEINTNMDYEFDIKYLSVKDFCAMLEYSDKKQAAFIQRYL